MLKTDNLVKDYGPIRAVDGVSFEVHPGDILGFLGPNGAGKSTTMKMVTGFLPPSSGTASICGHDILRDPIKAKRNFGYLPEVGPLYQEMTVLEFLRFIAELRGMNNSEGKVRLNHVLGICHLEEVLRQPIDTLSKGYRQRVGMAQAILHDPKCLIMDEPTDGLDPNQKREVRKLIASMAEDKAIILSTHILEEVQAMCNRVIIIHRGRVVIDETPDALRKRHPLNGAVYLSIAQGDSSPNGQVREAVESLEVVDSVEVEDEASHTLLIKPKENKELKPELLRMASEKQWQVTRLDAAPTPLEEVFASLTLDKPKNPEPTE